MKKEGPVLDWPFFLKIIYLRKKVKVKLFTNKAGVCRVGQFN